MRALLPLVALALIGCTHWADPNRSIETVVAPAAKPAKSIRVTLRSYQRLVVLNPQIRGDSVTGTLQNCSVQPCQTTEPVVIRLADIVRLETRKFDVKATTYTIMGVGAVAAFATVLIAWENNPFGKQ